MAKKKQNKFAVLILKVVGLDEIDYLLGDVIKQKLVRDIVYERLSPLLFTEKVFISRYSDDHFAIILKEPMPNASRSWPITHRSLLPLRLK